MERYLKDHPTAFDPETVTILSAALDDAWKAVETNKSAYQIDGHADGARNELAKHIVDLAKQGEREPQRLIQGALDRLRL